MKLIYSRQSFLVDNANKGFKVFVMQIVLGVLIFMDVLDAVHFLER